MTTNETKKTVCAYCGTEIAEKDYNHCVTTAGNYYCNYECFDDNEAGKNDDEDFCEASK
jgi:hypothetical protein